MRQKIKELTYIAQSQKTEIRLYHHKIDNIGLTVNGALTRGDMVSKKLEVNIEQGTIYKLDINLEKED